MATKSMSKAPIVAGEGGIWLSQVTVSVLPLFKPTSSALFCVSRIPVSFTHHEQKSKSQEIEKIYYICFHRRMIVCAELG